LETKGTYVPVGFVDIVDDGGGGGGDVWTDEVTFGGAERLTQSQ